MRCEGKTIAFPYRSTVCRTDHIGVVGINDLKTGVHVEMTQSRGNKNKRNGGSTSEPASDLNANMAKIRARLKLLDFRLESLQRDFVSLTVSRRHVALARSQYRTRLDLKSVDRRSGKKREAD